MRVADPPKRGPVAGLLALAAVVLLALARPAAAATEDLFAAMNVERPAREAAAPGFRLQAFEGGALALEELRGKVVAFYFWRTW